MQLEEVMMRKRKSLRIRGYIMMGFMLSAAMYRAVHRAVVVCAVGQKWKENAMETERDEGEDLDESVPVLYTETEKNEINSSRLFFTAEIPDGFGLDVQLTVCHQESGDMYQVAAMPPMITMDTFMYQLVSIAFFHALCAGMEQGNIR